VCGGLIGIAAGVAAARARRPRDGANP